MGPSETLIFQRAEIYYLLKKVIPKSSSKFRLIARQYYFFTSIFNSWLFFHILFHPTFILYLTHRFLCLCHQYSPQIFYVPPPPPCSRMKQRLKLFKAPPESDFPNLTSISSYSWSTKDCQTQPILFWFHPFAAICILSCVCNLHLSTYAHIPGPGWPLPCEGKACQTLYLHHFLNQVRPLHCVF